MSELSERERLINELKQLRKPYHSQTFIEYDEIDIIADFILKDRARIIEPLVNFIDKQYGPGVTANADIEEYNMETLKRAMGGE